MEATIPTIEQLVAEARQVKAPASNGAVKPQGAAFTFRGFEDVLKMPPKQYLIGGLIGANDLTALVGLAKTGKTLIALDMAAALMRGNVLFADRFEVGDPCPACYMTDEGKSGVPARLRALQNKWDLSEDERGRFIYCDRIVTLMGAGPRQVEAFIREFKDAHGSDRLKGGLIVIDTFARAMAGGEENAAKDTTIAQEALSDLREALQCSILVPSHMGYTREGIRGSSNLPAGFDGQIFVRADENGNRCVASGPSKDTGDFADVPYRIQVYEYAVEDDKRTHKSAFIEWLAGDAASVANKHRTKEQERTGRIVGYLANHARCEASAVSASAVAAELELSDEKAVREILGKLHERPTSAIQRVKRSVKGKSGQENREAFHYWMEQNGSL